MGTISLQARVLIARMRAIDLRHRLGRASRRGERADPHGGGIIQATRARRPGLLVTAADAGGSPAGWIAPVGANSGAVNYYLHIRTTTTEPDVFLQTPSEARA